MDILLLVRFDHRYEMEVLIKCCPLLSFSEEGRFTKVYNSTWDKDGERVDVIAKQFKPNQSHLQMVRACLVIFL